MHLVWPNSQYSLMGVRCLALPSSTWPQRGQRLLAASVSAPETPSGVHTRKSQPAARETASEAMLSEAMRKACVPLSSAMMVPPRLTSRPLPFPPRRKARLVAFERQGGFQLGNRRPEPGEAGFVRAAFGREGVKGLRAVARAQQGVCLRAGVFKADQKEAVLRIGCSFRQCRRGKKEHRGQNRRQQFFHADAPPKFWLTQL